MCNMKKYFLILFVFMFLTGCVREDNYEEELIGVWDHAVSFDSGWMINSYSFFDDGRCSINVDITTDYEIRNLAYDNCVYEIVGNDVYIDGEQVFWYDIESNCLYGENDSRYVKITDDPCDANYNKC